jgi:hypothetical protein
LESGSSPNVRLWCQHELIAQYRLNRDRRRKKKAIQRMKAVPALQEKESSSDTCGIAAA